MKSTEIVFCDFRCRFNIKSRKSGELNAQHLKSNLKLLYEFDKQRFSWLIKLILEKCQDDTVGIWR